MREVSSVPPRETMRRPSEVVRTPRLPRKKRLGQTSPAFWEMRSATAGGRGELPKVKYVGSGTVIWLERRRATSEDSALESSDGEAKRSPMMRQQAKEFLVWSVVSLVKREANLPWGAPATILRFVRGYLEEGEERGEKDVHF